MAENFTVWLDTLGIGHFMQYPANKSYAEPAEAADVAERYLNHRKVGARAEIRFNGDAEPHTIIFVMEEGNPPTLGIWNTPSAMWPLYYADSPYGMMLDGNPFEGENDGEGEHKKDDDSDRMDLGGMDDAPDTESEGDSEEFPDQEDDEDEESEEDDPLESGDDEDDSEERDDDEKDESENETPEESEADEDEDGLDDDGENETDQEEKEMPRLRIFAKMRGPKGWRKRAEAEELLDRNTFALKVGVLQDGDTPAQQEKREVCHVQFIETDENRGHGVLKIKLPDGVTLDNFQQVKSGWINVEVPYGN